MNMLDVGSEIVEYQKALGERIRRMRRERQMTQLELAGQVGVTNGQISTIERGLSAPSIGTLRRIAAALAVPIVAFFESAPRDEVTIVRLGDRQKVTIPDGPDSLELLAGSRSINAFEVGLAPDQSCSRNALDGNSDLFLYVLRGQIELMVDRKSFLLKSGDSVQADGRYERTFRNVGDNRALVIEVHATGQGPV